MPMAKKSSKARKLEALERSQQINQALETSTIESAALLSSAGESRPTLESHVLDLLDSQQQQMGDETPRKGRKGSQQKASKRRKR